MKKIRAYRLVGSGFFKPDEDQATLPVIAVYNVSWIYIIVIDHAFKITLCNGVIKSPATFCQDVICLPDKRRRSYESVPWFDPTQGYFYKVRTQSFKSASEALHHDQRLELFQVNLDSKYLGDLLQDEILNLEKVFQFYTHIPDQNKHKHG